MTLKRILILSANPSDKNQLRLEKEIREIRNIIKLSELHDQIELYTRGAVQPDDLQEHLLEIKPHIIHFCGHSTNKGLIVENENGFASIVSSTTLASLLRAWVNRNEDAPEKLEAIILNSCYSEATSLAISQFTDYVIGMPHEVEDDTAIAFSRGIYRGIGAGLSIKASFNFGLNAIELIVDKLPNDIRPVLIKDKTIFDGIKTEKADIFKAHFPRVQVLWRLAYTFLLLDQLPSGGWSKTLNTWMESIWEGDNGTIPRNQNMRISGGTDLTAYAFYHYSTVLQTLSTSSRAARLIQRNGTADRVYENFKAKIGYQGGIGTRQIPHGGSLSEVRIRHTLMGIISFLAYGELRQFSTNIQEVLEKTCHYLENQIAYWEHDQSHLFAMVSAAIKLYEILSTDTAKRQLSSSRIERLKLLLAKHIPGMIEQLNQPTNYMPSPEGTIQGPLHGTIFPPYFNFWRMERSNFMMYFPFLVKDKGNSFLEFVTNGLQIRCAQIIAELLEEIDYPYNEAKPSKQLIWFHRLSDIEGGNAPTRDWGLSAEFAAILDMKAVEDLVSQVTIIDSETYQRKKDALYTSLLATFDKYNSDPTLFKFTQGASFSKILYLLKNSIIDFTNLEQLDSQISNICSEGVTEKDLVNLVTNYLSQEDQNINIDFQSIKDLLLNKIESGEHTPDGSICDVNKWKNRIYIAARNSTIDFYNSNQVDLHVKRYESTPQFDLTSALSNHFPSAIEKNRVALDVGCGAGQYAELLIKQGFDVHLMDASKKMLELTRKRLKLPKDKFNLQSIFDADWGYSDNFFDLIFACALMVHIPKKEVANIYKIFYRIMKPNGLLFVNYKIGDHSLIADDGRFFEYYRDKDQPQQEITNAGFRVEDIILKTNYQNMYNDPKQISWANFYCKKDS